MKAALTIVAVICAVLFYTAWMNGVFQRCPHCRKIGSWRYDSAEPAVEEKDEDGSVVRSSQIRVCRSCRQRVLHKWSDDHGRTTEKLSDRVKES